MPLAPDGGVGRVEVPAPDGVDGEGVRVPVMAHERRQGSPTGALGASGEGVGVPVGADL